PVTRTGVPFRSDEGLLKGRDADTVASPGALVGADGLRTLLAVADGLDAVGGDALRDQVLAHRVGAPLTQRKVVLAGAAFVALAFDGDRIVGVLLQPLGLLGERAATVLADVRHVGVEENAVADVLLEVTDRAGRDARAGIR